MQKYADINHDSGVDSFENGDTYIKVLFKGGSKVYVYTYSSAGAGNVEEMKRLALSGDGLNSFIMRNVKKGYSHIE